MIGGKFYFTELVYAIINDILCHNISPNQYNAYLIKLHFVLKKIYTMLHNNSSYILSEDLLETEDLVMERNVINFLTILFDINKNSVSCILDIITTEIAHYIKFLKTDIIRLPDGYRIYKQNTVIEYSLRNSLRQMHKRYIANLSI